MIGFKVTDSTKQQLDPKNSLSKLRREKLEEAEEIVNKAEIMEAGQENQKKGMKEVKRQVDEERKVEQKQKDDLLNKLDMKSRFQSSYKRELAQGLQTLLVNLDWIKGWTADVMITDGSPITIKGKHFYTKNGILVVVCTPDGRVMHQGMLITQNPPIDYAGVYTLALQVENTMDKERGLLLDNTQTKPNSGIILPNGHSR